MTKSVPETVTVGAHAVFNSGPFVGAIPLTIGGAWVNRPMAVPQRSVLVELVEPYSSANQTSHGLAGSRCAPE